MLYTQSSCPCTSALPTAVPPSTIAARSLMQLMIFLWKGTLYLVFWGVSFAAAGVAAGVDSALFSVGLPPEGLVACIGNFDNLGEPWPSF